MSADKEKEPEDDDDDIKIVEVSLKKTPKINLQDDKAKVLYTSDDLDMNITNLDMIKLWNDESVCAGIVDIYLDNYYKNDMNDEDRSKCFIFNTDLSIQLSKKDNRLDTPSKCVHLYKKLDKNIKSMIDVFTKEVLFFPICRNNHWILITICYPKYVNNTKETEKKCDIYILDSLTNWISHDDKTKIAQIIFGYLKFSSNNGNEKFLSGITKTFQKIEVTSQSISSKDCGIHMFKNIEYFIKDFPQILRSRNKKLRFCELKDIMDLRKKAYKIIYDKLNENSRKAVEPTIEMQNETMINKPSTPTSSVAPKSTSKETQAQDRLNLKSVPSKASKSKIKRVIPKPNKPELNQIKRVVIKENLDNNSTENLDYKMNFVEEKENDFDIENVPNNTSGAKYQEPNLQTKIKENDQLKKMMDENTSLNNEIKNRDSTIEILEKLQFESAKKLEMKSSELNERDVSLREMNDKYRKVTEQISITKNNFSSSEKEMRDKIKEFEIQISEKDNLIEFLSKEKEDLNLKLNHCQFAAKKSQLEFKTKLMSQENKTSKIETEKDEILKEKERISTNLENQNKNMETLVSENELHQQSLIEQMENQKREILRLEVENKLYSSQINDIRSENESMQIKMTDIQSHQEKEATNKENEVSQNVGCELGNEKEATINNLSNPEIQIKNLVLVNVENSKSIENTRKKSSKTVESVKTKILKKKIAKRKKKESNHDFKCTHCDKSFKENRYLKKHLNSVHEKSKLHKCPNCPKEFADISNLIKHKIIHTNSKPFKCVKKNCTSSFTQNSSLKRHNITCKK